jgi:prevent-host-death family protein
VRRVPLPEIKGDLPRFLREAEDEELIITRKGKPAGVLIGFASRDAWPDYRLENDRAFCAASRRRDKVCERDVASGLKMQPWSQTADPS